ncbi:pentapeptide repeat-containing protein [Streptomyces sp. NPDC059881]|uniref:pentapeptide repeat-containing protein n=1 Tax=Streptomyces sp. NPDC059881 TaxID=3346986 RepID=UPI0036494B22
MALIPRRKSEGPRGRYTPKLWSVWLVAPLALIAVAVLSFVVYQSVHDYLAHAAASQQPRKPVNANDVIKTTVTVLTLIGAVLAGIYAYRKQLLAEGDAHRADASQLADRYTTAAEQLGHDQAAVRLAGVYALARLADDWTEQRQVCVDVLCAYLRMPYAPDPAMNGYKEGEREVRHTIIRVIRDHLRRPDSPSSWISCDFDFTSAIFDGGDFSECHFFGKATFGHAKFVGGTVLLDRVQFCGTVTFEGAVFNDGIVSFAQAMFNDGLVNFREVKFLGGIVGFAHAMFNGSRVTFGKATFSGGKVSFLGATFGSGTVDFEEARIDGGRVSFPGAKFIGGDVTFDGMELCDGEINFGLAQFTGGIVSFNSAKFNGGTITFQRAKFNGSMVTFELAKFSGSTVVFRRATIIDGVIIFDDSTVNSSVTFQGVELGGGVISFRRTEFSGGEVTFAGMRLRGGTVSFDLAIFGGTRIVWDSVSRPAGV